MPILADSVSGYLENASWIRRMFELGSSLKSRYGAENVFDFSLGNPDLPPPPQVGAAMREIAGHADEPFAFGYMPNSGFPWLRDKLAAHLSAEQGVKLKGEEVILTCGAAGGINAFLRAVLNPGEEVMTFSPYFVEYGFYCENHGGRLKAIPSRKDTFSPDLETLEKAITDKTRAVLINSPHNPTGAVYSAREMSSLARLLENKSQEFGRPVWLIADEPYRFLTYDGVTVPPVLSLYPFAATIGSLSKNMSLPGERIGYIAISPKLPQKAELMAALALTNRILGFVNPPVVGQRIMGKALGSNVDIKIYAARRKAMSEVLDAAGYEYMMPKGAFYFFPKAPGEDDVAFTQKLLEEKILAVPGTGFGCPGHFRLAFCVDEKVIRAAAPGFARAFKSIAAN